MRKVLILFALLLSGCASVVVLDNSTHINVAPSAHFKLADVQYAAQFVALKAGRAVFTVCTVSSEQSIDNETVVRIWETEGLANTRFTEHGVIINFGSRASPYLIAHELLHSAGLDHHPDPRNVMHPFVDERLGDDLELTDEQIQMLTGD